MKECTKCGLRKPLEDFQRRTTNRDGRTKMCKTCKREYDNQYYLNKTGRKEQITSSRTKARIEVTKYKIEYLKTHPCVDCGETDFVVLEFDHLKDKKYNVSSMGNLSLAKVQAEIEKCEVRCANCHRRKTAKQFGYYAGIA